MIPEQLVPIFRVKNAEQAAKWYMRLGFEVEGEHRFAPGMPLYLFLKRGANALHLSEHTGDAKGESLAYFYIHDIDAVAAEFSTKIIDQPWRREVHLSDPDGNRLRLGERKEA